MVIPMSCKVVIRNNKLLFATGMSDSASIFVIKVKKATCVVTKIITVGLGYGFLLKERSKEHMSIPF